jgi:hypothetical protein
LTPLLFEKVDEFDLGPKMSDLARYIEVIVEPTFKEFSRNPTSVRYAFLSCVVVYHAVDRAAYPDKAGTMLKQWREESREFKLVEIVANHFKHVKSGDEKVTGPGIPVTFILGLSDSVETMETRNFYFVIREAIKFLHEKAKNPIKPSGDIGRR